MTSMFWGLKLEPGKRYSTTVDKSFHISMATLDTTSVKNDNEIVSVILEEGGGGAFLLSNLRRKDILSTNLDLNFMTGDRITLFCKGQGVVHLSGYMVLEDDDDLSGTMIDDEAEEEEEEVDNEELEETTLNALKGLTQKKEKDETGLKRKQENEKNKNTKKKKIDISVEDSEDESDDGEDDDDDLLGGLMDEEDSDAGEEEEEDDDDENGVEEEESKVPTKNQKNQNQNKSPNKQEQQQKKGQKAASPKTPNGVPAKEIKAKPAKPQENKTTLSGGVNIKDLKQGNGPICKPGKFAVVYYTGRLKSNGKVFDSVMQGSGFKFRVGKGEVIKGWDIGVAGMKVGGKRIVTCPPQAAYGQKGSPPQVPPNSTLVFEIELKSIH